MSDDIASLAEKWSYSEVLGRVAKLARLLEGLGVPWEAWQWPIDDPAFRARLASYWQARGDIFAPYAVARLALGDDLITPEEIMAKRKPEPQKGKEIVPLVYTPDQLATFQRTLAALSLDYLKWLVEHNYALVAGPPESKNLLGVRKLDYSLFSDVASRWYNEAEQKFSREEEAEVVWHAIRKDHVPDSTDDMTYTAKCDLLLPEEQVSTAVKVAWVCTTYAKVRGVCLHKGVWVLTSSRGAKYPRCEPYRVIVMSDLGRFRLDSISDRCSRTYGVVTSREVPNA